MNNKKEFFSGGFFDWQTSKRLELRKQYKYDPERFWGGFTRDNVEDGLPDWAIGPFEKHHEPIFEPDLNGWDKGHLSGGVHNGSIIKKDGYFYYIYRGERPHKLIEQNNDSSPFELVTDYICDIGVAVSKDGINFNRVTGPLFRHKENERYSFEDVCVVEKQGVYHLFCNRWDFEDPMNTTVNGVVHATSNDLINWSQPTLVFPKAKEIHRNACVIQNKDNQAVKINGKYWMYLNNFLVATSDDLMNWSSDDCGFEWPGGEGCFALADDQTNGHIILFTGGHHSGHFYAIGEVLFSKENPKKPLTWLERPVLKCDDRPYENGYDKTDSKKLVSAWQDTIFFTGMTYYEGSWLCYYGGSEYYTCLAKTKKN